MVLADLGASISNALRNLHSSSVVDKDVVAILLKEISNALIMADVQIGMVMDMRKRLEQKINLDKTPPGVNKKKMIHGVVFDELCGMLDPHTPVYVPQKGQPNVIMFVGLQGAGKTTTVTKLGHYYRTRNWRVALVCADTFRAGAFDQLKQNAARSKIPFHGSYTEADPVKIAREGVDRFKAEGYEIIIVDTSGRHKQEASLFDEMVQVTSAIAPQQIVFVMDGSIGQAAFAQAEAFKARVDIGSVILTKLDGHKKGGGALAAVAATRAPITFIGTGEQVEDLDRFEVRSFVSKLLGFGDMRGLMETLESVVDKSKQPDMIERLKEGIFTLRDMLEQFVTISKLGPINKVMDMIPGMSQMLKDAPTSGEEAGKRIKAMITIMQSMSESELDNSKDIFLTATKHKDATKSRIVRIARGSGRSVREVTELIEQYRHFEKVMKKLKGLKGLNNDGTLTAGGMEEMAKMIPPRVLKQMGGLAGMQRMMNSMQGGDMTAMNNMISQMGGVPGGVPGLGKRRK